MPYINQVDRKEYDKAIRKLVQKLAETGTAGHVNYAITRILTGYTASNLYGPPSYSDINEAIGILECVKLELYSRLAGPLEQMKLCENGDVPEYDEMVEALWDKTTAILEKQVEDQANS